MVHSIVPWLVLADSPLENVVLDLYLSFSLHGLELARWSAISSASYN